MKAEVGHKVSDSIRVEGLVARGSDCVRDCPPAVSGAGGVGPTCEREPEEDEDSKSKRGDGGAFFAEQDHLPGSVTPRFRRAFWLARFRALRTSDRACF